MHPVLERKHKQMAADIKEQFVRIDQKYEELAKILDRKGVFGGWRPVYRAFMEELWKVATNYTGKTAEIQASAIASKYYKYGADPEVLTEVGELFGLKEAVEVGVTPPVAPEGVDEFIELKDTPDSYEGQGGKTVRVRSDEKGLEFAETIDEFSELRDTPNTYAGQAKKIVRVRGDETGLEFAEAIDEFAELKDTPNTYTGHAEKFVRVRSDETGLEFAEAIDEFVELKDTPNTYSGQAEKFVRVRSDEAGLEFAEAIDEFAELRDTPDSYEGQAGKVVRVRSDEAGLEFAEIIDEFAELKDTPNSYAGQAGKVVRVRSDETGLEFAEAPSLSSVTLIVAASDSLHKERADFVCDGVDDQEEINNAINSLPAGGGKVVLLEGTYHLTAPIRILKSNVVLEGNGWNTVLFLEDGSDCNMIEIGDGTVSIRGIRIKALKIDGNGANQTAGNVIYVHGASGSEIYDVLIKNCYVLDGYNTIISISYGRRCVIRNNLLYTSANLGAFTMIYGEYCDSLKIVANELYSEEWGADYGIYLYESSNFRVEGNDTKDFGTYHIYLDTCDKGLVIRTIINDAGYATYGIYAYDVKNSEFRKNIIDGVTTYGIYVDSGEKNIIASNIINGRQRAVYGIYVYDCYNTQIKNNIVYAVTDYCISASGIDGGSVEGNLLYDAMWGIDFSASHCVIKGNVIDVSDYGMEVYDANENLFKGNFICQSNYGIYISNSNSNSIIGNHFNYGNTAIYVGGGCGYTYICANYFNGNLVDIDDSGYGTIYAYTEDIPLMMSSDAVDASTTGAKNYEHSEQLWSAPNIYNVMQALVIIDYDWAATADGTFQLYSVSFGIVLGESSSKSGGESSRYETFSVDIPFGETSILMRANITTAGASGEQVTLHRAILRLLRSLNYHIVVIFY